MHLLIKSPDSLDNAASDCASFAHQFFRQRSRPVRDWPSYIEIQERLGNYGATRYHGQDIEKEITGTFEGYFRRNMSTISRIMQKHCYLTAALWPQ